MKKSSILWMFALLMLAFGMSSCSSDEEDTVTNNGGPVTNNEKVVIDPDGIVDKITVVVLELFDSFVFGSFNGFDEVFDKSALSKSVFAFKGSDVLGGEFFEFWFDFASDSGFEDTEGLADFVVRGDSHTEAVFGVVFE